jgi:hypothetical protein
MSLASENDWSGFDKKHGRNGVLTSNQEQSVTKAQFFLLNHFHAKPGGKRILCLVVIKKRDPDLWIEPSYLTQLASGDRAAGACWIAHALATSGMPGTIGECLYVRRSVEIALIINRDVLCFIVASFPNDSRGMGNNTGNWHSSICRHKNGKFLGIKHGENSFHTEKVKKRMQAE